MEFTATAQEKRLYVASAVLLALLFWLQPIFTWVPQYTEFSNPFVLFAVFIMFTLLPAYAQHATPQKILKVMRVPDWIMLCFVSYVLLRLCIDNDDWPREIRRIGAAGVVYLMARFVGRNQSRVFLVSTFVFSLIMLLVVMPYVWTAVQTDVDAERIRIFQSSIANQWPSVGLGATAVVLFVLGQNTVSRRFMLTCGIASGLLLSFPLFMGARAVVVTSFIVILGAIVLSKASMHRRMLLLTIAWLPPLITFNLLPHERIDFLKQVAPAAVVASPVISKVEPDGTCVVMNNSIMVRRILYRDAVNAFLEHPFFGVGAAQYGMHSCIYGYKGTSSGPHSSILHVASELGLSGLVMFLGLIGWITRQGLKAFKSHAAAAPVACALFLAWGYQVFYDQFSGSYFTSLTFYLLSGVVVGLLDRVRESA